MQKKFKALGMVLLAVSLTTAVGVSVNTETASAKKVNAKTLKLKKKKLSMDVGEKQTLKVTVKPKKASLTWKSNKKKVATVTNKGVVKSVKKGTAKITVTSGKKKATCTVTVKPVFKSVEVVNSKVVRVKLSKAKKLAAGDFAVAKKAYSDAKTSKALKVEKVNNTKNKTYELVLATDYEAEYDDNAINDEDCVSVTIKKLKGVKTKETVYYAVSTPSNFYVGGKTGEIINKNIYYQASYRGYLSSVKVEGLPAGLKSEVHNQFVTIKGVPTAVENGTTATITAKDESGKALTQKVLFYIGSDTQIVTYIPTEGRTILANDDYAENYGIHAYGGSGSYTYALVNNTNPYITISEYDYGSIRFGAYSLATGKKEYLPAAKYSVAYSVADSINPAMTASGTLDVTAVNGVKFTGSVVAGDNTPIGGATVSASFKDDANAYFDNVLSESTEYDTYTDSLTGQVYTKGNYELTVYPDQAYSLRASAGGAVSGLVNFNPGNANQVQNFALPIYKVVFNAPGVDLTQFSFDIDGVDGDGYKGYGTTETYLKSGTYMVNEVTDTITTHPDNFTSVYTTYKVTGTFTVAGNMTADLAVVESSKTTESSINDTPLSASNMNVNSEDYYKFTPSEDGKYAVACDYSYQEVRVYNMDGSLVGTYSASPVDKSETDYQCVTGELKKGTQYLFAFEYSDSVEVDKYVAPAADDTENTEE